MSSEETKQVLYPKISEERVREVWDKLSPGFKERLDRWKVYLNGELVDVYVETPICKSENE